MKCLYTLIIVFLSTYALAADILSDVPSVAEKHISKLDKDLDKSFKKFLSSMEKEIATAEKKGDVGLAADLQKVRQGVLKQRHFSELGLAADSSKPIAISISSKWLKKQFNATKAAINKKGVVTLFYDFKSAKEARDFAFSADDCRISRGSLSIGALVRGEHVAKWDGDISVRMKVAHANRKGPYVQIGRQLVEGRTYNSWFIRLGTAEAKFASDYFNSGSLVNFRELSYTLKKSRAKLDYGVFEGTPVTVGAMSSPMRRGSVTLFGADGGAAIQFLTISGVLNMDDYLESE